MADYAINFAHAARKELESLDANEVKRIFTKIMALSKQPRPSGCLKLTGADTLWRIRVGDYRVIYEIDDTSEMIDIIRIRHRSKAYD
jgi:mRNA interferase RelE/StbE